MWKEVLAMNINGSIPSIPTRPVNADKDWKTNVNDHDQDDVQKAPVQQQIKMEKSVQPNLGQKLNAFA
jgi:hypothetical protein